MEFLNEIRRLVREAGVPPLLALIVSTAFLILVLIAIVGLVDSKGIIALLCVIIGSAWTSLTSILLARENRNLQLSLASLDKRLQVHQSAYALWNEMVQVVHDPERLSEIIKKANDFWANNSLYLDPISRKAFRGSIRAAWFHKDLLRGPRDKETENIIRNWEVIMKPGRTLVEGVSLPSLGSDEYPLQGPNNDFERGPQPREA